MEIKTDVRTLEDFEQDPSAFIRDVQIRHRPLIISTEGRPGVVIIPADMMKDKMTAMQAACELAEV